MDWQYWCFVLALSTSIRGQFVCPEGAGCSRCSLFPEGIFEIDCTVDTDNVVQVAIQPNEYVKLTCNKPVNWTEFHLSTSAPSRGIKSLTFQYCNLPEAGLGSIAEKLLLDNLETLTFSSYRNISSTLTRNGLRGFGNVKKLVLSNNHLSDLSEDFLQDFQSLTLLNLRENNLQYLPINFFRASKLQFIELGLNKLTNLKPTAFDKVDQVKLLNIWSNKLTEIAPGTFDKFLTLETLGLQRNNLSGLPVDLFVRLVNLKILNLSSNNFTPGGLPDDLLKNNVNLESFTLFENKRNMTTMPNGFFADLTKLRTVKLRKNGLSWLPENLFWGTTNLRNISLEGNFISALPEKIFNNTGNLTTLDLSFNELSSLPDGVFSSLVNLIYLDLSRNHITTVSGNLFSELKSLKNLNMANNQMISVHFHGLDRLRNLAVAKFSNNALTFQSPFGKSGTPFKDCLALEELYLDHNNISTIFEDWTYLTNLRILDISYNNLQVIKDQDLQFLSQKIRVDFTHNNISRIDLTTVEIWTADRSQPRNVIVAIEHNPIRCDCELYDLLRYREGRLHPNVQNAFIFDFGKLKCDAPEEFRGITISNLRSHTLKCAAAGPEFEKICPPKCDCYRRPDNKAFLINCAKKNFIEAPRTLKSPPGHTVELNLSGNLLTTMPRFDQPGYDKVSELTLDHNNISAFTLESLSSNLKVLKLNNNRLTRLDEDVIEFLSNSSNLTVLTLQDNPWFCDCEARDFLHFVQEQSTKLRELTQVKCLDKDVELYKMIPEELCPTDIGLIIGGCLGIAFLGIIIGTLAAAYYRYQKEVKVWLYSKNMCLWFVTEDELDRDKLYDAFISYSHNDEDFVVNDLMPKLEEDPRKFKLCVHFRDWLAGEWIPKQIARSVEESRRTIVVLSPNFLESVWGRMEFRAAHSQALSEGRARVIVVLYGDIGPTDDLDPELKAYLSMNTYVKWGDPWFWEKLKYAMPHPPDFGRRKLRGNIFETTQPRISVANDKSELIDPSGIPTTPPITTTPPADSVKLFIINGDIATNNYEKTMNDEAKINGVNTIPIVFTNSDSNKNNDAKINKIQCTPV